MCPSPPKSLLSYQLWAGSGQPCCALFKIFLHLQIVINPFLSPMGQSKEIRNKCAMALKGEEIVYPSVHFSERKNIDPETLWS